MRGRQPRRRCCPEFGEQCHLFSPRQTLRTEMFVSALVCLAVGRKVERSNSTTSSSREDLVRLSSSTRITSLWPWPVANMGERKGEYDDIGK